MRRLGGVNNLHIRPKEKLLIPPGKTLFGHTGVALEWKSFLIFSRNTLQ